MDKVVVILGPTAVGKTRISIKLAKKIKGEIISADSMQVYKMMDIGTAKPSLDEMEGIKHHLIDIIYPDKQFSVVAYQKRAYESIEKVTSKNKIPIIVGGTGLYLNSIIYNVKFSEASENIELRDKLLKEVKNKGNEFIHKELEKVDPTAAQRIHTNDVKRIIRAFEIYEYNRTSKTKNQEQQKKSPAKYDFIIIGLTMGREIIYKRINERVDIMFERGLVKEVKNLIKRGYGMHNTSMQALGYKEVALYLKGLLTFDEVRELVKKRTRQFAKRQMTWFKRIENIQWLDINKLSDDEVMEKILINI